MREVEKNGIMIDICPSCKGVWLDRGELDKLMQDVREVRQDYNEWYYGEAAGKHENPRDNHHGHSSYPPYKKKKKSVMDMFGDLFD